MADRYQRGTAAHLRDQRSPYPPLVSQVPLARGPNTIDTAVQSKPEIRIAGACRRTACGSYDQR